MASSKLFLLLIWRSACVRLWRYKRLTFNRLFTFN
jgi:hypothetical protein